MRSSSLAARSAFAALYLAAQLALLVWGLYAPDHVFGFQMFNESSRIEIRLFRRVLGHEQLVPVPDGVWRARDARGELHTFRWQERVRYRGLSRLDRSVHASYGLDAALFRLQRALEDVAAHIPQDAETRALVAQVRARRNGAAPEQLQLVAERP